MTNHRVLLIAAVLGALAVAGGARAQDEEGFKMPSGNVFCIIETGDGSQPTDLRCDIQQTSTRLPRAPASCPLSWGDAFAVTRGGALGYLVCHGDTTRNDDLPSLPYGATWNREGFTCLSAPTGLTCQNGRGHGFMLSRAVQRVF